MQFSNCQNHPTRKTPLKYVQMSEIGNFFGPWSDEKMLFTHQGESHTIASSLSGAFCCDWGCESWDDDVISTSC